MTSSNLIGRLPPLYRHLPWWRVYKAKRISDLIIVLATAVFWLPILAMISIAIRLNSSGPVLFSQPRLGYQDTVFRAYKFRTMVWSNLDLTSSMSQSTRNDPRVTMLGRFLRRTSLDELPLVINVIKGDLSLVGPRPQLGVDAEYFKRQQVESIERWWSARKSLPPGLVNPTKVEGFRGAVDTQESFERILQLELDYMTHRTLLTDFRWLALWLISAFGSRGAY